MKRHTMVSIRTKLVLSICALLTVSMLALAYVSVTLNTQTTRGVLEQSMRETAKLAADMVANKLEMYQSAAADTGRNPILSDPNATHEQIQAVVDATCTQYADFTRGSVIGADGIGVLNGNDYNEREYFKQSMQGKTWISDPLIAKTTGMVSVIVSAPIWKDGIQGGTVVGVLFFVPTETLLNDIAASIKVSPNGGAYMLNKSGTTIAHRNMDNVKNMENTQQDAKTDAALAPLADLEKQMAEGASGFGYYAYGGVDKYLAFAPINGTDGWSIAVNAPLDDFMGYTRAGIQRTATVLVIALIVGVFEAIWIANGITKPIKRCAKRLTQLADGDLLSPVPESKSKDETGILLRDLNRCVTTMRDMLGDVSRILREMAKGNLDVAVEKEYPGNFSNMRDSLQTIIHSFNDVVGNISQATMQVSNSAELISRVSQNLSESTTGQAATIEQFDATITEIQGQAGQSSELARRAKSAMDQVSEYMAESTENMSEMTEAMATIEKSSHDIQKVIKVIDDIAFQTNIIALNAAVEAARAGQFGKGFGVVADEVRTLAAKSAEAATETADLIQESVANVKRGTEISGRTAESLAGASRLTQENAADLDMLDTMARRTTTAITEINAGIHQISEGVQSTSATAEESAASAEEMNAQSHMLNEVAKRFRLRGQPSEQVKKLEENKGSHRREAPGMAFSINGKY